VIERIFKGIRPAVVALIAAPLLGLGRSAGVNLKNIWIPVVTALSIWLLNISPVYVILAAILLGTGHYLFVKQKIKK
jgi:chromate transporter